MLDMAEPATSTTSLPSPEIAVGFHGVDETAESRPALASHVSEPVAPSKGFQSPLRHHRRTPSAHREVKETLNARTEYLNEEDDGRSHHRINQYVIREEIGRGSYGAVHLATDQFGTEYAVKEFSKARLRKRAQSHILRHGNRRLQRFPPRAALNAPLSPHYPLDSDPSDPASSRPGSRQGDTSDALYLIREEIAIMKKLNHPNLVQLIEVLDDPEEDSLYMVLEMCKKGVVMKVGLDEQAEPYGEETCRHWFRDLILGIEYLHAQGVIHRDIKPDNLLLTKDDVLKIVDFGVSEIFEKPGQMMTAKSAGSPAFLAPELCVARHGDVSGTAADIWSMGVSLYCLRYGRIPFERADVLEMYNAIKSDTAPLPEGENADFIDLISKILEKDPAKRIVMADLRAHPWVTKGGSDPLLSAAENCADLVEPPNALELNRAFTRKMNHLLCVMKAIQKLKVLLAKRRAETKRKGESSSNINIAEERARAEEVEALLEQRRNWLSQSSKDDVGQQPQTADSSEPQEPRFLGIGTGARDDFALDEPTPDVVSSSPTNVDFNVYDRAYEAEVERIMAAPARNRTMYLTRFVKEREQYKAVANMSETSASTTPSVLTPRTGVFQHQTPPTSGKFADLVTKAMIGSAPPQPEV